MAELVPTLDLQQWRGGDPRDRDDLARRLDDACRASGFFQIVNHRVPAELSDGLMSAIERVFALDLAEKLTMVPPSPDVNRGYAPVGTESLSYSLGVASAPDLFEAFNVGPEAPPTDHQVDPQEMGITFAPNIWPEHDDGFRTAVTDYFSAVEQQAHELTSIFDQALGVAPGFFAERTRHSTNTLRLLRYEAARREPDADVRTVPRQLGMGAHTDYGILTVLLAEAVEGLQILAADDQWCPVVPGPGALLINLGDLLSAWTNDRWRSTLHRVLPPRPGTIRRSAAFFHDGDYDALIECLPTCTSAENPPRYPPIRAGAHIRAKLAGPRSFTGSEAISTIDGRDLGT